MFERSNEFQTLSDAEFTDVLQESMPILLGYARSLTKSADGAEDLLQEAACNAWKARASFQRGSSFRGWMCTIIRNRFLSDVRRQRWIGPMPTVETEYAPPSQLDHLRLREMEERISGLPAYQRAAILLVAGGETYDDAARAMGCEVGTVKSRVCRARQALAALL